MHNKDGYIFYVGITNNPANRGRAHRITYGEDTTLVCRYENLSMAEAKVIETATIKYARIHNINNGLKNKRLSISPLRYNIEIGLNRIDSHARLILGQ